MNSENTKVKFQWGPAVLYVLLIQALGNIGSFVTIREIPTWYASLVKPDFNPPNFLFGPVWTTLYTLLGLALYLVIREKAHKKTKQIAIGLFAFQMVLNIAWTFIFFDAHALGWGFAEIIVLWFAILATIISFARVNKVAAWLMVPYLAWVTFASLLNYSLWQLNS